ncbi:MAG: anthranilate synthase component I [candidate division Zixibacteria bacterium]|nr:anthranilate synthase component I [candidate division Zixibacteria bacterium]
MYSPSQDDFARQYRTPGVTLVPVWIERDIGTETPEDAFLKIRVLHPYAFLLESMEGDERTARYSFVGADPVERLVGTSTGLSRIGKNGITHLEGNPIERMREVMQNYRIPQTDGLPRFSGGAVGYFGYDVIRCFEDIPDDNPDELHIPDLHFMIAGTVIGFDHVRKRLYIVANVEKTDDEPEAAYARAVGNIEAFLRRLEAPSGPSAKPTTAAKSTEASIEVGVNVTAEVFQDSVRRAREYIASGDAFQVVLSQRFSTEVRQDPFDVYRTLAVLNPSPYLFYLRLDDIHIVGASPETMVLVEDGQVTVRPIAGTRRRGATPEEDRVLIEELLADPKECAEHVMLVDLGRNDVGRVCEYGTVRTTELMVIEKYSHVIHIVSNVAGRLRPGVDGFDVLRATFPAGTLSGAPKIRAMEIIDELETTRRGIYGGALGYIGFSGNMDLCIIIRTMLVKDGRAYIQAGAGIVADSVPESEHLECRNKAAALLRAIQQTRTETP